MIEIVSVNISKKKGEVKIPADIGILIEEHGLQDDAHAGSGHRQVSLLAVESIEKMTALTNISLSPGSFAENITTKGVTLHTLPVGTRFTAGGCLLEVTQIGKECHSGCAIFEQVGSCVMPKEGIFAKVLKGGSVKRGDEIIILEENLEA